jgi:hypothetical protein
MIKMFVSRLASFLLLVSSVVAQDGNADYETLPAVIADGGWADTITTLRIDGNVETMATQTQRDPSCRIYADGVGSGTLIAKHQDLGKTIGVVVTCAHIFNVNSIENLRKKDVVAQWRNDNNQVRAATVLCVDWSNDMCALAFEIHPDTPIRKIADKPPGKGEQLSVVGYGENGVFQMASAKVEGYSSASWVGRERKHVPARASDKFISKGKNQIYMATGGSRKGDSGGGIVNDRDELVGVFWGGSKDAMFGTYSGDVQQFLATVPSNFQWAVDPRFRKPPKMVPVPTPGPGTVVKKPDPPKPVEKPPILDPKEVAVDPPDSEIDKNTDKPDPHNEILDSLDALAKQLADLKGRVDEVAGGQETIASAMMQSPTKGDLAKLAEDMARIGEDVKTSNGTAMEALAAKFDENKDAGEVTLHIKSDRFISPAYVDVSALWALQQKTGVDHMVLIVDTGSDSWQRMASEFEAARKKFAAIDLFDVATKKVKFKSLPQLVIYKTSGGGDPIILNGNDTVSKKLSDIARGGSVGL